MKAKLNYQLNIHMGSNIMLYKLQKIWAILTQQDRTSTLKNILSSSGFSFLSFFWLHHTACGILASTPGNEPRPSTVKVWSPNTGLPGNSLVLDFLYQKECEFLFYQSERKNQIEKNSLTEGLIYGERRIGLSFPLILISLL